MAGAPRLRGPLSHTYLKGGFGCRFTEEIVVNNIVSKITIFGPAAGWVQ